MNDLDSQIEQEYLNDFKNLEEGSNNLMSELLERLKKPKYDSLNTIIIERNEDKNIEAQWIITQKWKK